MIYLILLKNIVQHALLSWLIYREVFSEWSKAEVTENPGIMVFV